MLAKSVRKHEIILVLCLFLVYYISFACFEWFIFAVLLCDSVTIERDGSLRYQHAVDSKWNVSDYVIELKERLKTWRDVFWYIWSTVNYLTCDRCHESFPCAELGQCLYHPDALQFNLSGTMYGSYSCCNQKQLRFDPMQANTVSNNGLFVHIAVLTAVVIVEKYCLYKIFDNLPNKVICTVHQ